MMCPLPIPDPSEGYVDIWYHADDKKETFGPNQRFLLLSMGLKFVWGISVSPGRGPSAAMPPQLFLQSARRACVKLALPGIKNTCLLGVLTFFKQVLS